MSSFSLDQKYQDIVHKPDDKSKGLRKRSDCSWWGSERFIIFYDNLALVIFLKRTKPFWDGWVFKKSRERYSSTDSDFERFFFHNHSYERRLIGKSLFEFSRELSLGEQLLRWADYKRRQQQVPIMIEDHFTIKFENVLKSMKRKCAHPEIRIFLTMVIISPWW